MSTTNQPIVLICDDHEAVHESLTQFFESNHLSTRSAYTAHEALDCIKHTTFDLIVLDVMLPDMSGIEICQTIKKKYSIPIIFLSARSEEFDRIIGLEMGGDDYVTKPFSPREVVIRAQKLIDRNKHLSDNGATIREFHGLTVDIDTLSVYVLKNKVDMTAKEVMLLYYLISNPYKVLNREQILKNVWGYDYYGDTRSVDAVIKRIRKKLPDSTATFEIQSVYGVGYRLGEKA
ncbi:response regulator transcription factor [Eubacterium oxidoreducens]|uniref:Stage 0 sporulation protein A homolog n=1 Tax=Eubacterium oxidoreducens TaxID=1732 RepID=A0A1G6BTA0_EUBOX|nr:response regulator transcription factor [Eubacterium oxidoreducens]SDB23822.1 DNA-binding response regulator, OmpR family, contains REC and winged-helix (wHTH) domain [Eubacterium oxidoreducens]